MSKPKESKPWSGYARYSSLAFQLFAILGISLYAGNYLDSLTGWSTPIITILLLLFAFVGFMVKLVKELK